MRDRTGVFATATAGLVARPSDRLLRQAIVLILLAAYAISSSALAQDLAGDWIGRMAGGFKVRIHFERTGRGFSGKLINPSAAH